MILGSVMLIDSPLPDMRIPVTTIIATALAVAAFFMFVVGAGVRALWSKTTTGREALVGELGVARSSLAPRGQIFLRGELWNAESEVPVDSGATVRVIQVEGLTLRVAPVQRATAASGSVAPGRSE
jgi:membrane-bound serine protease (ClpP class)